MGLISRVSSRTYRYTLFFVHFILCSLYSPENVLTCQGKLQKKLIKDDSVYLTYLLALSCAHYDTNQDQPLYMYSTCCSGNNMETTSNDNEYAMARPQDDDDDQHDREQIIPRQNNS